VGFHKNSPLGEQHPIHNFEYPDITARTTASGLEPSDIGKGALQLDNSTFWILLDNSPVLWGQVTTASGLADPHAFTHEQGGVDELLAQDLGSGPTASGLRLETDGGGGWNLTTAGGVVSLDDLTDVDLTTTPPVSGEHLEFDGTEWVPGSAGAPDTHAPSHILNGSDEIDGDQLGVDFSPNFYTPSTAPAEVTDVDHLTAHLAGIDDQLGPLWIEDEFTPTPAQVTFFLSQAPLDINSLSVKINGVTADDTTDYTISGTTLTWLNNLFVLDSGDKLLAKYK